MNPNDLKHAAEGAPPGAWEWIGGAIAAGGAMLAGALGFRRRATPPASPDPIVEALKELRQAVVDEGGKTRAAIHQEGRETRTELGKLEDSIGALRLDVAALPRRTGS